MLEHHSDYEKYYLKDGEIMYRERHSKKDVFSYGIWIYTVKKQFIDIGDYLAKYISNPPDIPL